MSRLLTSANKAMKLHPRTDGRQRRHIQKTILTAILALAASACSMSDIVGEPTVREGAGANPDAARNESGALLFYQGVISSYSQSVSEFTVATGILTDELGALWVNLMTDVRQLPENVTGVALANNSFGMLNYVRVSAQEGRGLLREYAKASPPSLRGHLYALEGMANVMLAEFFCSGIPLGRITFDGKTEYGAGVHSEQIYEMAIALFDTALSLAGDSVRIAHLASVGKGRALLNLERFDEAAEAVASVPTSFRYLASYGTSTETRNGFYRQSATGGYIQTSSPYYSVRSEEGINGLPFLTSNDWRTDTAKVNITQSDLATYRVRVAEKYAASGSTPIIVASGVEARLIESEAYLQNGDPLWRVKLNELRQTCTPTSDCSPVLVTVTDGNQLPDIGDISSFDEQVDTLFKERAAWLYLTGHRQGDMRRLIRQYSRLADDVYPIGPYTVGSGTSFGQTRYGSDVTMPVPVDEHRSNSSYSGCTSRGA